MCSHNHLEMADIFFYTGERSRKGQRIALPLLSCLGVRGLRSQSCQ